MNFAREIVDASPPGRLAMIELARDGGRREWSFGEVADRSARLAGALRRRASGDSDVVMTLIGNRPEWVLAMLACFRIGAVVLPCTEQLRAKDLRMRIDVAEPAVILADERNRARARGRRLAAGVRGARRALHPRRGRSSQAEPAPRAELAPEDPCLITFTSGTAGEPKAVVHAQRYLDGPARAGRALARRARGRARVVHRRERLVEVGAQRLHRALAAGRRRAAARRPLRPGTSASSCSRASAWTCCAWRRPSTA